ncbi:hypothetical protein LVY72_21945 [Arthrobacter sp. I2-34]|uniref:Uncharacterized protein n=1 Tax=Arthrobacter hankyongi TaxID=2904801 RepID=A0ABS9LCZ2_9MICC|nr:hypothetical protein [Arthrobacter hankyongi]MCG2624556.1 hypothetical protein [Arthrobacter hankyongi]
MPEPDELFGGRDREEPDSPQLRGALAAIRDLGRGPVPEASAAVAAFFVDRPVSRAPRRRRQRNFLAGVLVAASMGLGAGAVAAASGGFHFSVQAGADGTADFGRPGISSTALPTVTATPSPETTAAAAASPAATAPASVAAPAPTAAPASVPPAPPAGHRRQQTVPEQTKAPAKRPQAEAGPKQARTPAPKANQRALDRAGRGWQKVREDAHDRRGKAGRGLDKAGHGLVDSVREALTRLRGEDSDRQ